MKTFRLIFLGIIYSINSISAQNIINCNDVEFIDGKKIMNITDNNVKIILTYKDVDTFEKYFPFELYIENNGEKFTIDPSKIIIEYYNKKNIAKECNALTSDEWWNIARKNILWFGPDNTRKVTTNVNEQINNSGTTNTNLNSTTNRTATATTTIYTGEKDKMMEETKAEIDEKYLKKTTIYPNKTLYGKVIGNNPHASKLKINIPINEKIMVFDLSVE